MAGLSPDNLDELLPGKPKPPSLAPAPTSRPTGDYPAHIARLLAEPAGEDRSGQSYALVAAMYEWGYDDAAIVDAAHRHAPTVSKYGPGDDGRGDRIDDEVARAIDKAKTGGARGSKRAQLAADRQAEAEAVDRYIGGLPDADADQAAAAEAGPAVLTVGRLPDELWTASPALERIRRAAWSRLVSPEAVLGAVLARVAACTPHVVELPPIVARWAGLTLWVALAGPPGAAKSSAAGIAAELVEVPAGLDLVDDAPPGSGEGFVELLYGMVTEDDPATGKPVKVRRQVRHNVVVTIDEGTMLTDLASRSGSTLSATLRTAWSHGTLGASNASAERRRNVPGAAYVYGITTAIQPDHAGALVIPDGTGTAERILWCSAWAPPPPDGIDWPGALDWSPPTPSELADADAGIRTGYRRAGITVAPAVAAEVRAGHIAAQAGQDDRPAHWRLRRLKVAALLASLDGHGLDLTEHDWHLAGLVSAASDEVADHLRRHLDALEAQRHDRADRRHALRAARTTVAAEDAAEARAMASASRSAARAVHKHAEAGTCDGCPARCLGRAVASKHRALVSVEAITAAAVDAGWITERDGRYWPGESRPA
ncbi:MAG: hypothetical protein U0P45_17215 [Acidimicrobiales bacterium]